MISPARRLPPLNGLRVFEVVSHHLNFRLAAEEIGVTQGAVAQLIRGLEAELGMQLFLRRPQGLEPTEAGQQYAARIRRAFELIAEATRDLRAEPQRLTISVTPSLASRWLIPRLTDFTAAHPTIDLRIVATDRLSNFETDDVDLAVRLGQPPFGPGLNAELLHEQTIIAIGSPLLIEKLGDPGASRATPCCTMPTTSGRPSTRGRSPPARPAPHRMSVSTRPRLRSRRRSPDRASRWPAFSWSPTISRQAD